jgi:integrase
MRDMPDAYPIFQWLSLDGGDGPMTLASFWQNVWRPLLRRAGTRCRKPHTLRHTYASLLNQTGESLADIGDQLGHHSIKLIPYATGTR